jgi:hypothetical protein
MTTKDFVLIASVLRRAKAYVRPDDHAQLVGDFANALAATNPRFDLARFIDVCAGKDNGREMLKAHAPATEHSDEARTGVRGESIEGDVI